MESHTLDFWTGFIAGVIALLSVEAWAYLIKRWLGRSKAAPVQEDPCTTQGHRTNHKHRTMWD